MGTMGWIVVRGEENTNELSINYGLFEVCTRIRVSGEVQFDACQDTEGGVRSDSMLTFALLFIGLVLEFFAILCLSYLVIPPYRVCCDMVGSKKGNREWVAGCILLAVAAGCLIGSILAYYNNFNELVEQYDKEARIIEPKAGYGRFSYSFFVVGGAAALNWFSILFIIYEVILTRRTRQSRIIKKRRALIENLEEARLREEEAKNGSTNDEDDLGPVAKAELERQRRREEKRKRLEDQKRRKKQRQNAASSGAAFAINSDAISSSSSSSSSTTSSSGSGSGSDDDSADYSVDSVDSVDSYPYEY